METTNYDFKLTIGNNFCNINISLLQFYNFMKYYLFIEDYNYYKFISQKY